MNFFTLLKTPFPRPAKSKRNIFWLLLLGLSCSLFIILYKPFGIENVNGQWYYNLVIISMGIIFGLSIALVEWGIPSLFPKLFQNWTLRKAILWYSSMILLIGAVIFLYKSYLSGFYDFTLQEYFFVIGRTVLITITVSFFALGIYQFFNRKGITALTNTEDYEIKAPNGKSIRLKLKDMLYLSSNDNYVDIHYLENDVRKKLLFRTSLKNVEAQLVNPLTTIYRCHRGYLINVAYFKVKKMTSRSMTIILDQYDDELPVSKQYLEEMKQILQTRH